MRLPVALFALVACTAAAPPRSVYTALDRCTTTELNADEGWSTQRCPGTAGYTLLVHEGDLRQSVDVVAPGGAVYPLDFWSVITSAFSSVGPRAEWRVVARVGPAADMNAQARRLADRAARMPCLASP